MHNGWRLGKSPDLHGLPRASEVVGSLPRCGRRPPQREVREQKIQKVDFGKDGEGGE